MAKHSGGSGDKAIRPTPSEFKQGAGRGMEKADATERSLPTTSYPGSSKQPINSGTTDKHFNPQGITRIPKNTKQMNSGT